MLIGILMDPAVYVDVDVDDLFNGKSYDTVLGNIEITRREFSESEADFEKRLIIYSEKSRIWNEWQFITKEEQSSIRKRLSSESVKAKATAKRKRIREKIEQLKREEEKLGRMTA